MISGFRPEVLADYRQIWPAAIKRRILTLCNGGYLIRTSLAEKSRWANLMGLASERLAAPVCSRCYCSASDPCHSLLCYEPVPCKNGLKTKPSPSRAHVNA